MRGPITALMLIVALPAAAADTQTDAVRIVGTTIDAVIVPGYVRLADRTEDLAAATGALCDTPSAEALAVARSAFAATAEAWARVEFIRFGPILEEHRLERFHFWPDPRGIGLRQVQATLAGEDETAANADSLAGKSVALQGLPALEFLLYGTGAAALAQPDPSFRCRYAHAIAGNLAHIAATVMAEWQDEAGFRRTWTEPGDDNPIYRTAAESLQEYIEIFTTGFQIMAEMKLEPALGQTIDEARGRRAELWRSAESAPMLTADTAGLTELLQESGVAALLTDDVSTSWFVPGMQFQLDEVETKLGELTSPIDAAVSDPQQRGKLEYVVIVLKSLGQMTASRLASSLGVQMGFNSLDGD